MPAQGSRESGASGEREGAVSQVSLWEMAMKEPLGKLAIKGGLAELVQQVLHQGFSWLQLRNSHILKVAVLEVDKENKDPFDRLLVAQSQVEQMNLLTCDRKLGRYPGVNVYPKLRLSAVTGRITSP